MMRISVSVWGGRVSSACPAALLGDPHSHSKPTQHQLGSQVHAKLNDTVSISRVLLLGLSTLNTHTHTHAYTHTPWTLHISWFPISRHVLHNHWFMFPWPQEIQTNQEQDNDQPSLFQLFLIELSLTSHSIFPPCCCPEPGATQPLFSGVCMCARLSSLFGVAFSVPEVAPHLAITKWFFTDSV